MRRRSRRTWIGFGVIAALVSAATLYGVSRYGQASALSALETQARTDANLRVALLRAVLERPRAMPLLLSLDSDIAQALTDPGPASRDVLNRKLEGLIAGTNAAVIYVVGRDGIAVSASNWREPTSFVGNNYAFREYFSKSMADGMAEHFALGTVSNRPGLYISHRVGPASAPVGVVVVKMEFDQLESDWRDTGRPSFVTDDHNVVLITGLPSWRFMTTAPLAADQQRGIRESLQFGDAPLLPLPISTTQALDPDAALVRALLPGGGDETFLQISTPVASTNWQLQYFLPVREGIATALREVRLIAILILALVLSLAAIWLRRRELAVMTIVQTQSARDELERRVTERTHDLSLARDSLQAEITDHRATEARLQGVQQDLVQANRLAILGQVAAGVAHEINQPVATIRAYAENAKVFLERQRTEPAIDNLDLITGLTERIAVITDDLKALARRGRTGAEPVVLQDVIDGALVLLRSRFTGRLEKIRVQPLSEGLKVMGDRLRLEQVFINLFQNALEALEDRPDANVEVSAKVSDAEVIVTVADNGPGIAPDILAALFEPFNSSKEHGLGLGLVISKEIVTDYGGQIEVESGPEGTRFKVHLRKAAE